MMILSIFLILLLIGAFFHGYHRGFIKQLIYTLGGLLVFLIAYRYNTDFSQGIANFFQIFNPNFIVTYVTHIISFYFILAVGNFLIIWLARASKAITWLPVVHQTNGLAGGLLALVLGYFGLFIVLWTLTLLPLTTMHQVLQQSSVAQWIVHQTPLLTEQLIQQILGIGH
ncbi:CvpA family protein [Lactobacillus sp. CC-MHH1034]|uniref:CvpA family protein n=1 Tax=Agrilactobacillus fermenti TaxID=2586909 RepID=UPI001E62D64E|nr:CvpA family protein [Agrilactobacillus fermenti]MCD2255506.1 CvpA family protein [Agrilactobacillus fermenti]